MENISKEGKENKTPVINEKSKKVEILKCINFIFIILWMILVFSFSKEGGVDSSSTSGNTIRQILILFKKDWDLIQLEKTIEMLQPFARKLAHFTLYAVGGFLTYNLNSKSEKIKKLEQKNKYMNKYTITVLFCMFYAITDEIHQIFVPGRDGRVFDVIIDTFGAIFGLEICKLLKKITKK